MPGLELNMNRRAGPVAILKSRPLGIGDNQVTGLNHMRKNSTQHSIHRPHLLSRMKRVHVHAFAWQAAVHGIRAALSSDFRQYPNRSIGLGSRAQATQTFPSAPSTIQY